MNFKPLKNERQYKVTKKYLKMFKKNYEEAKPLMETVNEFALLMESRYRMIVILEAEIQDYEHR